MLSGTHADLPKAELTFFRQDLEDEARDAGVKLDIQVTDNGNGTVDISWTVMSDGDAGSGQEPGRPSESGATDMLPSGATSIADQIRDSARRLGVDVEILASIASIESSFRVDAQNPLSSAFGLFQFLTGTWRDIVQRHGADLGVDVSQRSDLRAQCLMGAALLRDNMQSLRNALGHEPKPGECYAAHFFGAGTASHLLQGGLNIRADAALGQSADAVIRANRSIFFDQGRVRSVGEVMRFFDSKMADALIRARRFLGATPVGEVDTEANDDSDADPDWLQIAHKQIGVKEAAGVADNPRIVEYFGATTFGEHPDSVPWCGAFVSFCLREADVIDKGSARAADWLQFGDELSKPRLGCIAVLKPQAAGSSGHVGFWVGEEGGRIQLLAGNQHDRVDITSYPETELRDHGLRWPHGIQ